MTPDQWALLQTLAGEIGRIVAANIREQPPKEFQVNRSDPSGNTRKEVVSMPQVMAELCDELKKNREVNTATVKALRGLEKTIKERML